MDCVYKFIYLYCIKKTNTMKNQKTHEELYQYLTNQRGYEIARRSLLRQMRWFEPTALENAMANSYALLMVANGGNKDEAIQTILKIYNPENLVKLLNVAVRNEEPSIELVNEILKQLTRIGVRLFNAHFIMKNKQRQYNIEAVIIIIFAILATAYIQNN